MLSEKLALREFLLVASSYEIAGVRTIEEIRHARLLQLLALPQFPTIQALATAIERSHAQVSQWKTQSKRRNADGEVTGTSNIDSASARWIEQRTGMPRGWMDNDPESGRWPFGDRIDPSEFFALPDEAIQPAIDVLSAAVDRYRKQREAA